jgi:fumarate hydratase class II
MKTDRDSTRAETDSMGEVAVPSWAFWGAQTQRAVANFSISGLRIPTALIRALGTIKAASARANSRLGLVEEKLASAIVSAAEEVAEGKWNGHFPIDVLQTGSGTSWNMNANEVIANRANQLLGAPLGSKKPVHPNDHVNRGQSSNDVIPTAIHVADRLTADRLALSLEKLAGSLTGKAEELEGVLKIGRTHLQDAVPMTLGREFSGWARQIEKARELLIRCFPDLEELAIGGTAIGTGLNTHPKFAGLVCGEIAARTGIGFRQAKNLYEAMASRDAQVQLMGALNSLCVSLTKIANDLRLLSSGPRAGLGEIVLPSLQPGSSIMPGKVNPVILEMTLQAAAHVMGKCLSVSIGGQTGPLELNMAMPLIGYETLSALELLAATSDALGERCIDGIVADEKRCRDGIEQSLALVTPLALTIGYDRAAKLAQTALAEGLTIREIVVREGVLDEEEAARILDPRNMLHSSDGH